MPTVALNHRWAVHALNPARSQQRRSRARPTAPARLHPPHKRVPANRQEIPAWAGIFAALLAGYFSPPRFLRPHFIASTTLSSRALSIARTPATSIRAEVSDNEYPPFPTRQSCHNVPWRGSAPADKGRRNWLRSSANRVFTNPSRAQAIRNRSASRRAKGPSPFMCVPHSAS